MTDSRDIEKPNEFTLGLVPTDIEVKTDNALRIPFDQLPAFGVGLSSLVNALAPATAELAAPVLFTVTDKFGNPISPEILQAFKDGSGLLGSYRDPIKGFGQARLHVADAIQQAPVAFDPVTLAIAAALAVVTQKLDSIQQTQEEMFEYLRQRDKAELRGAFQELANIARSYRYNWDNQIFLQSAHAQILEIRKQADSAATLQRAQIRGKIQNGPIEIRASVEARLTEILDRFAEYRLATYTYALASFLEPMLSDNLNASYLRSIAEQISAHGLAYRELYTECYEAIEEGSRGSLDATLLGGIAEAGKALGSLFSKTPIGELTPVDDALTGAGEEVGKFNESLTDSLLGKLREMQSPEVLPLQQGVESLAALRERPMKIAADSGALYLIAEDERYDSPAA